MKRELNEILCCPTCKSSLELTATKESDGEVLAGTLKCAKCNFSYPIEDGIPNLLPKNFNL